MQPLDLPDAAPGPARRLSKREKAAVIVHLLASGGVDSGLRHLPLDRQRVIVDEIMRLRFVDRATLAATVSEFAAELDDVGLHFPRDAHRIAETLGGQLEIDILEELTAGDAGPGAWDAVAQLGPDALLELLEAESDEVGAILLSKLPPGEAADLLDRLPSERAEVLALAFARTDGVAPAALGRIGAALRRAAASVQAPAFADDPALRVAAVLNAVTTTRRRAVLERLDDTAPDFAARVRDGVFTFENVPDRLDPRDVPRVLRALDQPAVVAMIAATSPEGAAGAAFVLSNISSRLADQIREEIEETETIDEDATAAACAAFVAEIRRLEEAGELILRSGRPAEGE